MSEIAQVINLHKHFNGVKALDGFSCEFALNEIVGLIGPNGAGKTTLFNVISGLLQPDSGSVLVGGKSILECAPHQITKQGVARSFQELRLVREMSALDNILLAFGDQPGEHLTRRLPRVCPALGGRAGSPSRRMRRSVPEPRAQSHR